MGRNPSATRACHPEVHGISVSRNVYRRGLVYAQTLKGVWGLDHETTKEELL